MLGQQAAYSHHFLTCKTALDGGPTNHGWPDDTYFSRLAAECANKGITLPVAGGATGGEPKRARSKSPGKGAAASAATASSSTSVVGAAGAMSATSAGPKVLSAADSARAAALDQQIAKKSMEVAAALRSGDQGNTRRLMLEKKALEDEKRALLK